MEMNREIRAWLTTYGATLRTPLFNRETFTEPIICTARERIEQRRAEEEERRDAIFVEEPDAGHYVQLFSFLNRASAERIRDEIEEMLADAMDEPLRVVIQLIGDYHRILAGGFSRYSEALQLLGEISDEYDGAFVITFPRDE